MQKVLKYCKSHSGFQDIINDQTLRKKKYNDTQVLISGEINFVKCLEMGDIEGGSFDHFQLQTMGEPFPVTVARFPLVPPEWMF